MTRLTKDFVADQFLAAAHDAGLKKVMVMVGKVCDSEFVVTISIPNPMAACNEAALLVQCCACEFDDASQVRKIADEKAANFSHHMPTIH